MKAYTISGGRATAGIHAKDGVVNVGESGRGRSLVRVPIPAGATVVNDRLTDIPGEGAIVLICDHSGFRGGWQLTAPRTHNEWVTIFNGGDKPERRPHGLAVIAEGRRAQGDAGAMGGGPEYLVRMRPGDSVEIVRSGRLYGDPTVIRIDCRDDGSVTATDARAEAETRVAAERLSAI